MRLGPCISVAFTILCAIGAARAEPTAAHVAAVKTAQQSNYIAATDCSAADTDVHGWAKDSLLECVYEKGPTHLKAQVFLVVIEPKVIASWIETTCAERLPGFSGCFKRVLECGRLNSGMMFPAAGNLLEDMGGGPWKNYFFRH